MSRTAVHYGEDLLIIRLKTATPAHLHSQLMKGLNVAQKMALMAEDLTKDEKDSLCSLNELMSQILPSEGILEEALTI